MPAYGDVREDGRVFRGYLRRDGKTYEQWVNRQSFERARSVARAFSVKKRAEATPEQKEEMRAYARAWQRNLRARRPELGMLTRAFSRAKARGLEFDLETADIAVPEVCPVLGIPLRVAAGTADDSSPELDRIDNRRGYTKDNVIVVSRRANRIKNDATVQELHAVASFYAGLQSEGLRAGQPAGITEPSASRRPCP